MTDPTAGSPSGLERLRVRVPHRARRLLDARAVLARRRMIPVRRAFYAALWQEAATAVGAVATDRGDGLWQIQRDRAYTFVRQSDLMLDSALTEEIIGDKVLCYDWFKARNLPVPEHAEFALGTMATAEAFLSRAKGPVVVKPAAGEGGGRGVTTGITSLHMLHRAAAYAAGFCQRLLIEAQIPGRSWRLLYLDGQFLDAVRRDPPVLVGDGRSSLSQLLAAENRRRLEGGVALSPLLHDRDMMLTLEAAGLKLGTVPGAGQQVVVKGAVNENTARENHTVAATIPQAIVAEGARLVHALGVRFAGVDLIADSLESPFRGVWGEINVNPGLHHHYLVADPAAGTPVAERILSYLFESGEGVCRP